MLTEFVQALIIFSILVFALFLPLIVLGIIAIVYKSNEVAQTAVESSKQLGMKAIDFFSIFKSTTPSKIEDM